MRDLLEQTAHAVDWRAVVLSFRGHQSAPMLGRLERFCPVLVSGRDRIDLSSLHIAVVWGHQLTEARTASGGYLPPSVLVAHGVGPWTTRAMADAREAAELVAVSKASLPTFPASERGRVRVIGNMVEPSRLVPKVCRDRQRAAWGVSPRQRALVMIGRLSDEKNPEAITEAVAELHRRGHREWVGVHVGDGNGLADCRRRAARVAPGLIRFPGPTEDVASALNAADLVALPSREEACSMVLLESLAFGSPIVASTVGILAETRYRELVRPVSPGCSGAELADAVLTEVATPLRERTRRIESGRLMVREDFGPGRFARAWTEVILRAAGATDDCPARQESPDLYGSEDREHEPARPL